MERGFGRGSRSVDPREIAVLEQRPRGLNEARQRAVGIRGQESARNHDRLGVLNVELVGETVDRVNPEHVDSCVGANVARRVRQYDRTVYGSIRAFAVVGLEIANVPGRLVDVGSIGVPSTLELEDEDGPTHKEHDVGTSELEWEFVLEDGGVVRRERVVEENLADLPLQWRDRQIPGTDLLRRYVAKEVLERAPDHKCWR
jgi:hypothetical protein